MFRQIKNTKHQRDAIDSQRHLLKLELTANYVPKVKAVH